MSCWDWSLLHKLELGQFAEAFARVQFAMRGWQTYAPFADNHGIDFIARHADGRVLNVQVKSVRKRTYAFVPKRTVVNPDATLVALVVCDEGEAPRLFLVPIAAWSTPNAFLTDRNYEGLKSTPEFGLVPSRANEALMQLFTPDRLLTDNSRGPS